jgi:hypothetical protein
MAIASRFMMEVKFGLAKQPHSVITARQSVTQNLLRSLEFTQ